MRDMVAFLPCLHVDLTLIFLYLSTTTHWTDSPPMVQINQMRNFRSPDCPPYTFRRSPDQASHPNTRMNTAALHALILYDHHMLYAGWTVWCGVNQLYMEVLSTCLRRKTRIRCQLLWTAVDALLLYSQVFDRVVDVAIVLLTLLATLGISIPFRVVMRPIIPC